MTRQRFERSPAAIVVVLCLALALVNCASSGLVRTGQVAFAVTQVLDVHSTHVALRSGAGREGNPLLRPLVGEWWKVAALKLPATAGVWWMTSRLERSGHPRVAFAVLAACATAVAIVAGHNYHIASRGPR